MRWTLDRIDERDETSPPLALWAYQFSEYYTGPSAPLDEAAAWCAEQFGPAEIDFDLDADDMSFWDKKQKFKQMLDQGVTVRWARTYLNQIVFRDEVDATAFRLRWC